MANRVFSNDYMAADKFLRVLTGWVTITGGSGAVDTTAGTFSTTMFSVARQGSAGLYRITLNDKYTALYDCTVTLMAASAVDLKTQLVSETVATTKLIDFRTLAVATPTDPAAGVRLYFNIVLRNSSSPTLGV